MVLRKLQKMMNCKVAIIVGPEVGNEYESLRQTLEYFGAKVMVFHVGRPNDFIQVISGRALKGLNVSYIVFCFHGIKNEFVMPELHPDSYQKKEIPGNFGWQQIQKFSRFRKEVILTNACTLGTPKMANTLKIANVQAYIAPEKEVDGNAALLFFIRFFYEILDRKKSFPEAFAIAQSINEETEHFLLY